MDKELEGIENVSDDLRQTASDLKVDSFLSLVRTAEVVNRYLDIELRKYGTSRSRWAILNILIVNGGTMKPTALSVKLFRSNHTVTRVVDNLERDGLVRRKAIQEEDRRVREISLTRKGLEFVKERLSQRSKISYQALSCLGDEQVHQLNSILKQIRRHLIQQIASSINE